MLDNIPVTTVNLESHKSDIAKYLFKDQVDFSIEISYATKLVYRQIKTKEILANPSKTDAEIRTLVNSVKDFSDTTNLLDRICLLTIAKILESNQMYDESTIYSTNASRIPLDYYIDENEDEIIDFSEIVDDEGGANFRR